MSTGEIVLAVATFLAVIAALGVGVMSLRQTKDIQRRQYRQNSLDEVIAWARDIIECEAKYGIPLDIVKAESLGEEARGRVQKGVYWAGTANLVLMYQAILNRSGYVKAIASELRVGLYSATERTAELLVAYLQSLIQYGDVQASAEAEACEHNLDLLLKGAAELMNEAAEARSDLVCSRPSLLNQARLCRFCSRITCFLKHD